MRLSFLPNIISFQLRKTLIISFLFCSALAVNAFGQEERVGIHSDFPVADEEIIELEGPVKEKEVPEISRENSSHQYKAREEKESKNGGMSTLSFNLFLYVVDRFKENN